ncbi:MAG: ATP-binding protein [Candidatus Desulfofervidus auxilii]|nr:ATP-binding protein [Candidatus Desulfofervidus auxilii]
MTNDEQLKYKVLFIEDDNICQICFKQFVKTKKLPYDYIIAGSVSEAKKILNSERFDVVIMDYLLNDGTAFDIFDLITDTPIIFVTGAGDEEVAVKAMKKGAYDYLIKDPDRNYLKMLPTVVENAIKHKKAEQRSRILSHAIMCINDSVYITDMDDKIIFVNKAFCKTYGYKEKEILSQHSRILWKEESASNNLKNISAKEFWHKMKDGTEFLVSLSRSVIKDENGNEVAIVGVTRDITKLKKTEEELRATVEELKNTQSFLVQQGKLMAIGQLAAGIAHEMNNPLGFVASNFRTLREYIADIKELLIAYQGLRERLERGEGVNGEIGHIKAIEEKVDIEFILEDIESLFKDTMDGIDRLTGIIKSLRDFSRIDQLEDYTEYDINEGIKSTLVITKNEYKYYAEVKTELGDIPPIYCHPNKINEVFLNLIVNAAQAIAGQNREEKGTIFIKTFKEGEFVYIQISDDGPGIPDEIKDKIFDPFFTTKPPGKGTGLGLSICYDIVVNKHKGQIWVESEVGKGTTFTVKLPIKPDLDKENGKKKNSFRR